MDTTTKLTYHAQDRIARRLGDIVTANEVLNAAAVCTEQGRSYVTVKSIPYTEISDPAVQPDGIARGDCIVAAVERTGRTNVVVTVMLRKSWSRSTTYDTRRH